MELRQIKYFVMLAELLNYSQAANALYITQPTLSQQIIELEKELGTKLFKRTKRKVDLTEAGKLFYIGAKDLVGRSEMLANSMINGGDHVPQKKLRFFVNAAIVSFGSVFHTLVEATELLKENGVVSEVSFELGDEITRDSLRLNPRGDAVIYMSFVSDMKENGDAILHEGEMVLIISKRAAEGLTLEEALEEMPMIFVNMKQRDFDLTHRVMAAYDIHSTIRVMENLDAACLEVCLGKGTLLMPDDVVRSACHGVDVATYQFPKEKIDMRLCLCAAWKDDVNDIMEKFMQYYRDAYDAPT